MTTINSGTVAPCTYAEVADALAGFMAERCVALNEVDGGAQGFLSFVLERAIASGKDISRFHIDHDGGGELCVDVRHTSDGIKVRGSWFAPKISDDQFTEWMCVKL